MTHFVNPKEVGSDLVAHLANMTKRGADRSAAPTIPWRTKIQNFIYFVALVTRGLVLHAVRSLNDEH
jgi:hypothetical protein